MMPPTSSLHPDIDMALASTDRCAMAYWACAQLVPNHERMALHFLEQVAGFEIYAPRIRAPVLPAAKIHDCSFPVMPSCSSFCSGTPSSERRAWSAWSATAAYQRGFRMP